VELERDRSKLSTVYRDIANLKSLVAGGARDTTEDQRKR
jgi:hypothetical protein